MSNRIFHIPVNVPVIAVMGNIFKNDIYLETNISTIDSYYSINALVFYPSLTDKLFPIEEGSSVLDYISNCPKYADAFYDNDPTFYEKYSNHYFCFKIKDIKVNYLLAHHQYVQYSFEDRDIYDS